MCKIAQKITIYVTAVASSSTFISFVGCAGISRLGQEPARISYESAFTCLFCSLVWHKCANVEWSRVFAVNTQYVQHHGVMQINPNQRKHDLHLVTTEDIEADYAQAVRTASSEPILICFGLVECG